jgi:hypothetical protein
MMFLNKYDVYLQPPACISIDVLKCRVCQYYILPLIKVINKREVVFSSKVVIKCNIRQGSTLTLVRMSGTNRKKFGQVNIPGHLSDWTSAFFFK